MQSFTQLVPQFSAELFSYLSWLGGLFEQFAWYLPFLFLLAITGTGVFIVSGRSLANRSRRTSYDKGARQIALLAVLSGWLALLGGGAWLFWKNGYNLPTEPWDMVLALSALLPAFIVLLLTISLPLWKFTGKHRVLWFFMGLLLVLAGPVTLVWAWCLLRALWQGLPLVATGDIVQDALAAGRGFLAGLGIHEETSLAGLWEALLSPRLCMTCCLLPLFFSIPAVLASLGFLGLRRIHDYGRDHYTIVMSFSLRHAARYGFLLCLFAAVFIGCQVYLQWENGPVTLLPLCSEILLLLVWLPVSLLLLSIGRSQFPLRHKVWIVLLDIVALLTIVPLVGEWLR